LPIYKTQIFLIILPDSYNNSPTFLLFYNKQQTIIIKEKISIIHHPPRKHLTLHRSSITQSLLFLQSIVQINPLQTIPTPSRSLIKIMISPLSICKCVQLICKLIDGWRRIAESEPRKVVFHAASPEQRFSPRYQIHRSNPQVYQLSSL
jgi:hypothetical protein